ncbi:MAG TPA: hypothetical protein VN618_10645 [Solirubrobacteraceae bacterium]|nr:hypothetical protein [Solirubrobacteraceae bacterium]
MADDDARRPSRALPVAGPPAERLEGRAEEMARRWAAELILARPLGAVGRISLEELSREAPGLCSQILRAVRSDEELARLLGAESPERGVPFADRPAALAGARDVATALEAIESLRGVLWEGLLEELSTGAPERSRERLLADLSDRLAHVCAALGVVAAGRELPVASARPARFPERPPGPRVAPERRVVIVDERGVPPEASQGGGEAREPSHAHPAGEPAFGGADWEGRASEPGRRMGHDAASPRHDARRVAGETALPPGGVEIAIRDARSEAGPAAWVESIGVQLERYERDTLPFAVVLMEVTGAGHAEAEIESALGAELRVSGGGTITRERDGRWWLLAPRADRIGAHALASRLERTAVAAGSAAGATVAVASGTAVCPEDGTQAAALAAQADVGLYAARWESRAGEGR